MKEIQRNKLRILQLAFLLCLIIGSVLIIRHNQDMPYQHDSGMIFGTVYNIIYQSDTNLKNEIEAALQQVDNSLSPFNLHSVITKINNNQLMETDKMFRDVFLLAQNISEETNGAFDITVAPLINLWGFGFKKGTDPDQHTVDSIMQFVGYKKVKLQKNKVKKSDPRLMLDCSAIAKGYGCDVVASLLKRKEIQNFMVEIGGEVVTCGKNQQKEDWRIGVIKPTDDSLNTKQDLQAVLRLTNKALATSGNYRNFYYKNGKKYAHTVDPQTGFPVQHNILSATVVAPTCAEADAYATSFMVLGLQKAQKILERHDNLMAYLIYTDEKGRYNVWYSPRLKEKIIN